MFTKSLTKKLDKKEVNKKMKKITSLVLVIGLLLLFARVETASAYVGPYYEVSQAMGFLGRLIGAWIYKSGSLITVENYSTGQFVHYANGRPIQVDIYAAPDLDQDITFQYQAGDETITYTGSLREFYEDPSICQAVKEMVLTQLADFTDTTFAELRDENKTSMYYIYKDGALNMTIRPVTGLDGQAIAGQFEKTNFLMGVRQSVDTWSPILLRDGDGNVIEDADGNPTISGWSQSTTVFTVENGVESGSKTYNFYDERPNPDEYPAYLAGYTTNDKWGRVEKEFAGINISYNTDGEAIILDKNGNAITAENPLSEEDFGLTTQHIYTDAGREEVTLSWKRENGVLGTACEATFREFGEDGRLLGTKTYNGSISKTALETDLLDGELSETSISALKSALLSESTYTYGGGVLLAVDTLDHNPSETSIESYRTYYVFGRELIRFATTH